MKNRNISHFRQEAKIYEAYYKPSMNIWRFLTSIVGVLIFGRTTVAHSYVSRKRTLK